MMKESSFQPEVLVNNELEGRGILFHKIGAEVEGYTGKKHSNSTEFQNGLRLITDVTLSQLQDVGAGLIRKPLLYWGGTWCWSLNHVLSCCRFLK